jgi:hypothetical protein
MCKACNKYLKEAIIKSQELLELAEHGDNIREDVGCGVLFGTIRDCAYKIRSLAESEIAEHERRGIWVK